MTTTRDPIHTGDADHVKLRADMVAALEQQGTVRSAAVRAAVAGVARHLFAPEADLKQVYAPDEPIAAKHDEQGLRTSSLSSATVQATMLEQAEISAGMKVLEIGSGVRHEVAQGKWHDKEASMS